MIITIMWKIVVGSAWLALHCLLFFFMAKKGSKFQSFITWCLVCWTAIAFAFLYGIISCYIFNFCFGS